jgi:hypothetical protein
MDTFKMVFGRRKIVADIPADGDVAELQQVIAKKALRDAALRATQHALQIGTISKTQAALISAHMKNSSSLRTILDELISTLETNGKTAQAAVVRDLDTEVYKGCVSSDPGKPSL